MYTVRGFGKGGTVGGLFALFLLVAGIFLFIKFPKAMLTVVGVIVVGCFVLWEVLIGRPERLKEKVTVSVSLDVARCDPAHPLRATTTNGSTKTVEEVSWSLGAYRPSYSTNLLGYSGERHSSDKILSPGETYELCYPIPSVLADKTPLALSYKVDVNYVTFQK